MTGPWTKEEIAALREARRPPVIVRKDSGAVATDGAEAWFLLHALYVRVQQDYWQAQGQQLGEHLLKVLSETRAALTRKGMLKP